MLLIVRIIYYLIWNCFEVIVHEFKNEGWKWLGQRNHGNTPKFHLLPLWMISSTLAHFPSVSRTSNSTLGFHSFVSI